MPGTINVLYCAKPLSAEEREKGYRLCDWCRITKKLSYAFNRNRSRRRNFKSEWVVSL